MLESERSGRPVTACRRGLRCITGMMVIGAVGGCGAGEARTAGGPSAEPAEDVAAAVVASGSLFVTGENQWAYATGDTPPGPPPAGPRPPGARAPAARCLRSAPVPPWSRYRGFLRFPI